MKKLSILLCFIIILFLLLACGNDIQTSSDQNITLNEFTTKYEFKEIDIPLSDYLSISDEIDVLDANENYLLFSIYEKDNSEIIKQIPNDKYKYLCKYDFINNKIYYQKKFVDNSIPITAKLLF